MVAQQVEHVGSKMSNRSRKNRSKTRRSYRNDAKDCVEAPLSVKNFFDNNFFSPTSIISPFPLNTEPGPTLTISSYLTIVMIIFTYSNNRRSRRITMILCATKPKLSR